MHLWLRTYVLGQPLQRIVASSQEILCESIATLIPEQAYIIVGEAFPWMSLIIKAEDGSHGVYAVSGDILYRPPVP